MDEPQYLQSLELQFFSFLKECVSFNSLACTTTMENLRYWRSKFRTFLYFKLLFGFGLLGVYDTLIGSFIVSTDIFASHFNAFYVSLLIF